MLSSGGSGGNREAERPGLVIWIGDGDMDGRMDEVVWFLFEIVVCCLSTVP